MNAQVIDDYLTALLDPAAPSEPAPGPRVPAVAAPKVAAVAPARPDIADIPPPWPAAPAAAPPPEPRRRASDVASRWLRLRVGAQAYALELLKVQEVLRPATVLPLRGAPVEMLGVMNLRGLIVPVLDLGLWLGQGDVPDASTVRIVVLEEGGELLGLRVSGVEDVTRLTEAMIEPPDHARVGRVANAAFRGVARVGGQPVILLDASRLLH